MVTILDENSARGCRSRTAEIMVQNSPVLRSTWSARHSEHDFTLRPNRYIEHMRHDFRGRQYSHGSVTGEWNREALLTTALVCIDDQNSESAVP
ncbi:hypothetical protein GCM10009525_24320 [Streptosporangium amethystogenes subsp. fukuiense]